MARVLVTGAGGFAGQRVCRALGAGGHDVLGFAQEPVEGASQCLPVDICDQEAVKRAIATFAPERAIHLAAIPFVTASDHRRLYEVNVIGALHVVEALMASDCAHLVLASSAAVYGPQGEGAIAESARARPNSQYGATKLAMEHMAHAFGARLPVTSARLFNFTGPGQSDAFVIAKIMSHFRRGDREIELGATTVSREYNDADAVCDLLARLVFSAPVNGPLNVCSGRGVTLNEVLEAATAVTGHQIVVRTNRTLLRPNEIARIVGDPGLLRAHLGAVDFPQLSETLRKFLEPAN